MGDLLAAWTAGLKGSAAELFYLLSGNIGPASIVAAIGAICLLVGVALSIAWRETQAFWMLPVIVIGSLAPVAVELASHLAGSLGVVFAILAGAFIVLLATVLIANDATRRSPIWILGIFSTIFALGCGLFGFDFGPFA